MKRFILYVIIIFQIGLIISLLLGIQRSLRSKERIAALQATKHTLEIEATQLKEDEAYVQSPYYLEKVAREELHLSKPGETVVIVPEGKILQNKEPGSANTEKEKPNWQQWLGILSGKIDE